MTYEFLKYFLIIIITIKVEEFMISHLQVISDNFKEMLHISKKCQHQFHFSIFLIFILIFIDYTQNLNNVPNFSVSQWFLRKKSRGGSFYPLPWL